MSKREAELKSSAMREAADAGFFILEYATAGAPDKGLVRNGRTTNWEFKHGTPAFDSPGNQELFCCRLAFLGHCRYVVWQEGAHGEAPRTLIVHPREVRMRRGWALLPETSCLGYDMKWLVQQIIKVHEC